MFIGIKKQLRDWDEETPIQSLRFMPSEYEEFGTYARPTKFHRGEKGRNSLPGMNTDYEEGILDKIKEKRSALEGYETEKDIRLPEQERERILSEHVTLPGYEQGYEMEGTWVSPADLRTILNPDVTFFQGRPTTLVGITQSPNFYRTAGEADKGAHEGFQFGGFNPESYFKIPTPETASHPVPIKEGLISGRDDVVNWLEDLQSNPNIPVGGRWDEDSWNQWQQTPRLNLEQLTEQGLVYPRTIKGEPMEIAFQLLKGRKMSPEAKKHKLEYDTKYQSSPERVKYRVELNRERRRRGIYGSGNGKDVSHTKSGKLTLENEHDNRARHFKGRGTLRDDKS